MAFLVSDLSVDVGKNGGMGSQLQMWRGGGVEERERAGRELTASNVEF